MLYFDHNATAPLCAPAREAWLDAVERYIGNPSSPHRLGARADAALSQVREKVAAWLGGDPSDILWTSGATESANTVFHHLAQTGAGEVWVSAIEHPCVLASAAKYFPGRHRVIPVTTQGIVDLGWIEKSLRNGPPTAAAIMAANNETGALQPWREAASLFRESGALYFCDAAQWIGKLPASGLGAVDFVIGCAHKFGGPQGVGFLKCPGKLRPLLSGGPQEDGRRAGTENVAGILAMIAALEFRESLLADGAATEREKWRGEFTSSLLRELPGSQILGGEASLWNTVSAIMPETPDCRQRWVVKLDSLGIAASTGSACASGKEETSHVLAAMDVPASEASRVLRFSSGWETAREDWGTLLATLRRAHTALAR